MYSVGTGFKQAVLALAVGSSFWATTAFAQHHDILVQDVGQRLATGAADFDGGNMQLGARVFTAFFDSFYAVDNPGFNSIGAGSGSLPAGSSALPGNSDLMWDFLPMKVDGYESNLLYWNGAGTVTSDVAFGAAPGPTYSLTLFGKNNLGATADGSPQIVPGQVIATTAASGAVHQHRFFFLDDDTDSNNATVAAQGVYLISMRLRMTGLDASDPLYVLWGTPGTSIAAVQAAAIWVESHEDELAPSFLADFDGNFVVDGADFLTWQKNVGLSNARQMHGDADRDRVVSGGDLVLWREQLGLSLENYPGAVSGASATSNVIPEPGVIPLAGLGALVVFQAVLRARGERRAALVRLDQ
jgi:hypothetical protein